MFGMTWPIAAKVDSFTIENVKWSIGVAGIIAGHALHSIVAWNADDLFLVVILLTP